MSKRRKNKSTPRLKIGGNWVAHQAALIRILRGLSLAARRCLDTLELEHCRRGGRENGGLVCTYTNFEQGGVTSRHSIARGLRELEHCGVIRIQRGRRAYADMRLPSTYTLTFLSTFQDGKESSPTHDWKKQKAGVVLHPGASAELHPGNGQKPVSNCTLREGESQCRIAPCYLDLGWTGGGGEADLSTSLFQSPTATAGTEPSAPSPILTAPSTGRLQ